MKFILIQNEKLWVFYRRLCAYILYNTYFYLTLRCINLNDKLMNHFVIQVKSNHLE